MLFSITPNWNPQICIFIFSIRCQNNKKKKVRKKEEMKCVINNNRQKSAILYILFLVTISYNIAIFPPNQWNTHTHTPKFTSLWNNYKYGCHIWIYNFNKEWKSSKAQGREKRKKKWFPPFFFFYISRHATFPLLLLLLLLLSFASYFI